MLAYIVPVAAVPKWSTALASTSALNGWFPTYQLGPSCSAAMPSKAFAHFLRAAEHDRVRQVLREDVVLLGEAGARVFLALVEQAAEPAHAREHRRALARCAPACARRDEQRDRRSRRSRAERCRTTSCSATNTVRPMPTRRARRTPIATQRVRVRSGRNAVPALRDRVVVHRRSGSCVRLVAELVLEVGELHARRGCRRARAAAAARSEQRCPFPCPASR